jgi:hypothetical protein
MLLAFGRGSYAFLWYAYTEPIAEDVTVSCGAGMETFVNHGRDDREVPGAKRRYNETMAYSRVWCIRVRGHSVALFSRF